MTVLFESAYDRGGVGQLSHEVQSQFVVESSNACPIEGALDEKRFFALLGNV